MVVGSTHARRIGYFSGSDMTALEVTFLSVSLLAASEPQTGGPSAEDAACTDSAAQCGVDARHGADAAPQAPGTASEGHGAPATLLFFWGVGCPHCEDAKPFVQELSASTGLNVESIEVRQNPNGRARFVQVVQALGIDAPAVPTFVYGDRYVIGFRGDATKKRLRALLRGQASTLEVVELPLFGAIEVQSVPLPLFTLAIGLADGFNPCAMWVLIVLLGVLAHTRSRRRIFAYGFIFVFMSGAVYFLFMTAWTGFFALMGLRRTVTVGLGVVVTGMGLINLKELVWFRRGLSLTISDKAKPGLYRRMRRITKIPKLPSALLAIGALAFFVNLIELGCTIGLPAVYARILTLREGLDAAAKAAYLALYNVAYVVPLASIVVIYALTLHRLTLSERGAKVLKAVSGILMVSFGVILIAAPELLSSG